MQAAEVILQQLASYATFLISLAGLIFAPFYFVDKIVLSEDIKKQLSDFLKSKSNALDDLAPISAELFSRIFGEKHFSLRCFFSSVAASFLFLTLAYLFRVFLLLKTQESSAEQLGAYIVQEARTLFKYGDGINVAISIAANILLDYLALLKTRLVIMFLAKRKNLFLSGPIAIAADLVISVIIFQVFYFVFYFVGMIFSFGFGKMVLPAGDPMALGPMIELMILLNFATSHLYPAGTATDFFLHSHLFKIIFVVMLAPITLTSVFFYASIAPSTWLWLFVFSGIISRSIGPAWPGLLYVMNFDKAPVAMLGIVAAIFVVFSITLGLALVSALLIGFAMFYASMV